MNSKAQIYRPKKKAQVVKDKELEQRRQEIDQKVEEMEKEYGGRSEDKGLEPTRYDDWEFKGRCIDF